MKKKKRTGSVMDTIEEMLKLKEQGITKYSQIKDKPGELKYGAVKSKRKAVKPRKQVIAKPSKQKTVKPLSHRYQPKDRTMITFYIDNKVHQKLKQICEADRIKGIKTAVSDLINLSVIKYLRRFRETVFLP